MRIIIDTTNACRPSRRYNIILVLFYLCSYYCYYSIIAIKMKYFCRFSSSSIANTVGNSKSKISHTLCFGFKVSYCSHRSRQQGASSLLSYREQVLSRRKQTLITNQLMHTTAKHNNFPLRFSNRHNTNNGGTEKLAEGDRVSIFLKNRNLPIKGIDSNLITKQPTGVIESKRGGGWYSIRIEDNKTVIKCRGSQLQRLNATPDVAHRIESSEYDTANDIKPSITATTESNAPKLSKSDIMNNKTRTTTNNNRRVLQWNVGSDNLQSESGSVPIIYDLDAAILKGSDYDDCPKIEEGVLEQARYFANYKKFVVFTDLHCSPTTLETCLEVLGIVHETAKQQEENCGVLFLGDFWHHRKNLDVSTLNAILQAFRTWTVPMIMIPGNHDQVTLGGQNHGLTPLKNSYRVNSDTVPGLLILSNPTIFLNALFIPHIRDINKMKLVVQSNKAKKSSALFVHTEIKGAMMNDMIVSTNGISPSVFPPHKHIYSGHFHKPHSIQTSLSSINNDSILDMKKDSLSSTKIEYLGSPYQISLAEAHQKKQIVILDAEKGWECEKRIPLRVGRCHFKSSSLQEIRQFRVCDENEDDGTIYEHILTDDEFAARKMILCKKGDRIVLDVPKKRLMSSSDDIELKSQIQLLRNRGVVVELRETRSNNNNLAAISNDSSNITSPNIEEMSPESIWRAYLEKAKKLNDFIDGCDHDILLNRGLEIIEETGKNVAGVLNRQHDLKLISTSISGFGPFEDDFTYPLDSRGLVLLRGSNNDIGSDSNGTGKSSLAMATLWALTGSLDARPASDLKVTDVINDNSKVSRVTVEGLINDNPFVITRTKAASKNELFFRIGEADLTTQSIKETQALVEERLGVNTQILTRVAFFGQHGMNDLLEATDTKLKDELSLVVPLDLWQQAAYIARLESRQAKKKIDESEGMIRLREGDVENLSNRVSQAKESRDYKHKHLVESEERLNEELNRIQIILDRTDDDAAIGSTQTELKNVSSEIFHLNAIYESTIIEKETELKPLEEKLFEIKDNIASMIRQNITSEMNVHACRTKLDSEREYSIQIEEKWSIDLSHGIPSVLKPPEQCPTCFQPLLVDGSDNSFQSALDAMQIEVKESLANLNSAENAFKEALLKASECSNTLLVVEKKTLYQIQSDIEAVSSKWNTKITCLKAKLKDKTLRQNKLTSQISKVVDESQLRAHMEAAKASFNEGKINYVHSNDLYESLDLELSKAKEFLTHLKIEKKFEEDNQSILSILGERFGQRGIQVYVLQNVVNSLQHSSQIYLDHLSEGSQRLELLLDAGDKIIRSAFIRGPDGEFRHRSLSTLSGGQWRRCSLALSFAFAELIASRGRLRSSLLVLDEPLTHLDRSGRTKFGELIRKMLRKTPDTSQEFSGIQISTVLLILQDLSAEELEEAFDCIDTVTRYEGRSSIRIDEIG